jgi:zinc protease
VEKLFNLQSKTPSKTNTQKATGILPKTQKLELKNGLKVLLPQSHKSPVVSIQMWVRTGSADEKKGEEGISHFIEHLVFKGTRKFKVGEVASLIEGSGGELNAYTSFDQTVFYVTISKQFVDTGLLAIAEMMGFPKFDPIEINNEREVVIEEIKRGMDSLGRRASQLLFSTAFQKHPYGIPVIGYDKNIRKVTPKKLKDYYHARYVPKNMFLVVAGDFENIEMRKKVNDFFGEFKAYKPKKIKRTSEPMQKKPRVAVEKANFEQSVGYLAWKVPGLKHPDTPVLDVLSMILGQGDSSRLVKRLRIEKPIVNSVGASVFAPEDQGIFTVSMGYQKEMLNDALEEIKQTILELFSKPFDAKEIESAVLNLETEKFYSVETVDGLARFAGSQEFSAKDLTFQDKYLRRVRKVRGADLVRVAKKYLKTETLSAAFVSNDETLQVKKSIKSWIEDYGLCLRAKKAKQPKSPAPKLKKLVSVLGVGHSEVERLTLKSGVKILFYPSKETHLVSVKAAFLGGLRDENDNQGGLTEMLARAWMGGTHQWTEKQINEKIDSFAAAISPVSGRNSIGLGADFISSFEDEVAPLFLDILSNPIFPEEVVEREKTVLLQEIKSKNDNPSSVAGREFMAKIFPGHPYSRDLMGDETSVSSLKAQDIKRHWAHLSHRKNLTVVVSGNFNRARWMEWLEKGTMALGSSEIPGKKFSARRIETETHAFKESIKEQSHVMYGFQGLTITDPERYALQVMQSILAGQGGRLFLELRDKNSLAYSVSPMRMEGVETGYFGAYIGCSPEKVQKAISMMKEQFDLLMDTKVEKEELLRAQRYLIGRHDIDLQRTSAVASSILYDEIYGNDSKESFKIAEKYFAVNAEQVQKLAKKIFQQKPVLVVVGPQNPWK